MSTGNGRKSSAARRDRLVALHIRFERGRLVVVLSDDREVTVPLDRYPTLHRARTAQRNRWRFLGGGTAIQWPDLDLDLSVAGLTHGLPEAVPRPPKPAPAASRVGRRSA
jgi:hypothetical protein